MSKRRVFDKQFKEEALRLVATSGKSVSQICLANSASSFARALSGRVQKAWKPLLVTANTRHIEPIENSP